MAENMTLGLSPCPNDTYIFHALLHHLVPSPAHFTPHMADVEELNALARPLLLPGKGIELLRVGHVRRDGRRGRPQTVQQGLGDIGLTCAGRLSQRLPPCPIRLRPRLHPHAPR